MKTLTAEQVETIACNLCGIDPALASSYVCYLTSLAWIRNLSHYCGYDFNFAESFTDYCKRLGYSNANN